MKKGFYIIFNSFLIIVFIAIVCAIYLVPKVMDERLNSEAKIMFDDIVTVESVAKDTNINYKEALSISLASYEDATNYIDNCHVFDSKAISNTWEILVKTQVEIEQFSFVEIYDNGEVFELHTFEKFYPDKPIILHTYINDATVNRGISFRDYNNAIRVFAITCSMMDGSLELVELDESENFDPIINAVLDMPIVDIKPMFANYSSNNWLNVHNDATLRDFLCDRYFSEIHWVTAENHVMFVGTPDLDRQLNKIYSVYISFDIDTSKNECELLYFRYNYSSGEIYKYEPSDFSTLAEFTEVWMYFIWEMCGWDTSIVYN